MSVATMKKESFRRTRAKNSAPEEKKNLNTLSIRLSSSDIERIEIATSKLELSRGQLLRQSLDSYLRKVL